MGWDRGKVRFSPSLPVYLALLLLLLPLRWIAAWIAAAAFHELGHLAALRAFGVPVLNMYLGTGGAEIRTGSMRPGQEMVCALAGPVAGLMLLLAAALFPRLALCAGLQSLYNLLPVYPLDGGRALRCGAKLACGHVAERVCSAVEWLCLCAIILLCGYGVFVLKLGVLPAVLGVSLLYRSFQEKFLANGRVKRYNSHTT